MMATCSFFNILLSSRTLHCSKPTCWKLSIWKYFARRHTNTPTQLKDRETLLLGAKPTANRWDEAISFMQPAMALLCSGQSLQITHYPEGKDNFQAWQLLQASRFSTKQTRTMLWLISFRYSRPETPEFICKEVVKIIHAYHNIRRRLQTGSVNRTSW